MLMHYQSKFFNLKIYTQQVSNKVKLSTVPTHFHGNFNIIHCLQGSISYFINGKDYTLEVGDTIFLNKNQIHTSHSQSNNYKYLIFEFDDTIFLPQFYTKIIAPLLKNHSVFILNHDKFSDSIEQILYQIDNNSYCIDWCLLKFITDFLLSFRDNVDDNYNPSIFQANNRNEHIFLKMLNFIETNFKHQIAIDDLITHVHINKNLCNELFKHYTNQTPMKFITEYRLFKAKNLLDQTDLSISDISSQCGFNQTSYFIKCFKNKYLVTPLQYRKHQNNKKYD